jgi:hypothetical protein
MNPEGATFRGFSEDISGPEELEIKCSEGDF